MISSNVIGLDITKTNSFGREGLELFLFFLLPHDWRPYCNIILAKENSVKISNKLLETYHLFIFTSQIAFDIWSNFRNLTDICISFSHSASVTRARWSTSVANSISWVVDFNLAGRLNAPPPPCSFLRKFYSVLGWKVTVSSRHTILGKRGQ